MELTLSKMIKIEITTNPKKIYYVQKGCGAWRERYYLEDVFPQLSNEEIIHFKRGYLTEFYNSLKEAKKKHAELDYLI
jgi:hypothetical protein